MMPVRALVTVAWSALVWVALWGDLSPANVLGGLAVGIVGAWVVPLGRRDGRTSSVVVHPLRALRFLGYFLWALVRSSAVVAWEVITPGSRIYQGIIEVRLETRSLGIATLIANAISLTPGTLTIEVREAPLRLYVHVLHLRDIDAVRAELQHLQQLATDAFPTVIPDTETTA